MKRIVALFITVSVVAGGCSPFKREPDFKRELAPPQQYYNLGQRDGGWLPRQERATQRFAWKMELLARRLQATISKKSARRMKVLMTTIVPVEDLGKATSFGRLCTEQLMTELHNRGFEVIEARKTGEYIIRDQEGEFSLSREGRMISEEHKADAVLVGAFSRSGDSVLVNVRLVSSLDAGVVSAASAMMNLRGDRFLNGLFRENGRAADPDEGMGQMRVRKRVDPAVDPYPEVLEDDISNMAGEIAETAMDKAGGGATLAVTTFVDVDNFNRATTFGRYMTEKLMAEFRTRGFNVIELRSAPDIFVDVRIGELGLTREMSQIMMNKNADVVVVGTYAKAGDNIAINSRLVVAKTQEVVGAGQMIVEGGARNKFVTAMLENEITTVIPTETVEGF